MCARGERRYLCRAQDDVVRELEEQEARVEHRDGGAAGRSRRLLSVVALCEQLLCTLSLR